MDKNFGEMEEYRSEYNFLKKKYEELNKKIQALKKVSIQPSTISSQQIHRRAEDNII